MFDQLKPLIQNGERIVVVEGGRPEFVILRLSDYLTLTGRRGGSNPGARGRAAEWEAANAELAQAGAAEEAVIKAEPLGPVGDPSTIRLEDLPL